jgi:NADH:ubiquinone oxidoreductase subunit 6 (subunit J)
MNGICNPIIFYPTAILIILFGILAIKFQNIFYSLLSAIAVFFLSGILFYVLGSEYNAIVQVAVYGLAVPVILGLGIMFTSKYNSKEENKKHSILKFMTIITSGILLLAIIYMFLISFVVTPIGFNTVSELNTNPQDVISIFGKSLFFKYIYAFEGISLILTIIIVGIAILNKEKICQK